MMQLPPSLAAGFVDVDSSLVFNWRLIPNPGGGAQPTTGLQQPIPGDGDFYLCGIQMTSVIFQRPDLVEVAGDASLRISDDTGYRLMSDYIDIQAFTPATGNSYPYVIRPAHLFKAGTRINIDLQELSGPGTEENPFLANIIQITFRGRFRYRLSDVQAQQALINQTRRFKRGER